MVTLFALLGLAGFIFLSWRSLEKGILATLFLLPLYQVRLTVGAIPITFLELMIVSLFIVFSIQKKDELSQVFQKKITQWSFTLPHWLWIASTLFLISATVSIFFSPDLRVALGSWKAYFVEPFLFFVVFISVIKKNEQLLNVMTVCLLSSIIIALIAIGQKITGWGIPVTWLAERRVTSIFPYPNAVGLYIGPLLVFTLPFIISLSRRVVGLKRAFGITLGCLSMGLLAAAIIFAKTEAAYIAVGLSLLGFAFFLNETLRRAAIVVVVGFAVLLFISPMLSAVVKEKVLLQDWSGKVRRVTWNESMTMLRDHPVTGAGLAGYQKTFEPYHKAHYLEIFLFPHNIVLNFWSETGIYGLASFTLLILVSLILLAHTARKYKKTGKEEGYIMACVTFFSITALLIHGRVDVPYFKNDLSVLFWMLIATTFVLYNDSRSTT